MAQGSPFTEYIGKPMFSGAGPQDAFVGRVVLELWKHPEAGNAGQPQPSRDASGLAVLVSGHSMDTGQDDLLQRVAAALPELVASLAGREGGN